MAKIVINEELRVNGRLTFSRELREEQYEDKEGVIKTRKFFEISGMLATHLYFDEINQLDTNRFSIYGVEVFKEDFGSDDYNIIYSFVARDIEIHGAEDNGVKYVLLGEEMKMIEDKMYGDDHPILGDIGSEYKYMIIENDEEEDESEEEKEE